MVVRPGNSPEGPVRDWYWWAMPAVLWVRLRRRPSPVSANARLDVAQGAGLRCLGDPRARRAIPARIERRAAGDVAQGVAPVGAARAPGGQEAQHAGQLLAVGAQSVAEAERPARVRLRDDDPGTLQAPEP